LQLNHVIKGEDLAKLLLRLIDEHNLDINKLVGQCHDGAANMSGLHKGAATRITQIQPKALYVHCYAHRLNLATEAACCVYPQVCDVLATVQSISVHVNGSAKRQHLFKHVDERAKTNLKTFSNTRWLAKQHSLKAIIDSYSTIIDYLRVLGTHDKPIEASTARGLLRDIFSFQFIFIVHVLFKLFSFTNILSECLQKVDNNVCQAKNMADATILSLMELKLDDFDTIYNDCVKIAKNHGFKIPVEIEHVETQRACKRGRYTAEEVIVNIDEPAVVTNLYKT
jgi:hypothetical protein